MHCTLTPHRVSFILLSTRENWLHLHSSAASMSICRMGPSKYNQGRRQQLVLHFKEVQSSFFIDNFSFAHEVSEVFLIHHPFTKRKPLRTKSWMQKLNMMEYKLDIKRKGVRWLQMRNYWSHKKNFKKCLRGQNLTNIFFQKFLSIKR